MPYHDEDYTHSGAQFAELRDLLIQSYARSGKPYNWLFARLENWRYARHDAPDAWYAGNTHLWRDDAGRLVGFCLSESGEDEMHLQLLADSIPLERDMVRWIEQVWARDRERIEIEAYADQTARKEMLKRAGYEYGGPSGITWAYDLARPYPPIPLPPGYRVETLAENGEHDKHIAVEQLTFNSDYLDRDWFYGKASAPGYSYDLDFCIVSAERQHVAFCLGWIDAANRVAEVDPVGTHPDYRRRGFAKAVVSACFRELARRGVRRAYIGSAPEPNISTRLYQSLGPIERFDVGRWVKAGPCR
jgi:mycothiol synthase